MSDLAKVRKQAGWSRDCAAVEAKVAYATCRIYEACPAAIADSEARARLDATYERIRSEAGRKAAVA